LNCSLILISDPSDHKILDLQKENKSKIKIFSLNIESHNFLESKGIKHEIAENFLSQKDRVELCDIIFRLYDWHQNKSELNELNYDNVNLLSLFDNIEFQDFVMPKLVDLLTIKRVIENEKPEQIFCSTNISKTVEILAQYNKVHIKAYQSNLPKKRMYYDKIDVKNFSTIPLPFKISKKRLRQGMKVFEKIFGKTHNLWFDLKEHEKKTVLLLEFNPELYVDLLSSLKKFGVNVILLNIRRPAFSTRSALNILKKNNCKLINFGKILTTKEKKTNSIISKFIPEKN